LRERPVTEAPAPVTAVRQPWLGRSALLGRVPNEHLRRSVRGRPLEAQPQRGIARPMLPFPTGQNGETHGVSTGAVSSACDHGHCKDSGERRSRVGKLIWHTMMSLDGFVAGPNDDMSWAFGVKSGSGETAKGVLSSTRALLGR
jgi:hypothetical protein